MIISRRKYEQDLKEAAEKAVCEAESRFYQSEDSRRIWGAIRELEEKVRRLEPQQKCSETEGCNCIRAY